MAEQPKDKREGQEGETKEKTDEEKRVEQEGKSKLVDMAREIGERAAERTTELFGSDGGSPEGQEKKKEASEQEKKEVVKSMGRVRFGVNMLGAGIFLALAGSVALPFWGMKKILEADKNFMKGFDLTK